MKIKNLIISLVLISPVAQGQQHLVNSKHERIQTKIGVSDSIAAKIVKAVNFGNDSILFLHRDNKLTAAEKYIAINKILDQRNSELRKYINEKQISVVYEVLSDSIKNIFFKERMKSRKNIEKTN